MLVKKYIETKQIFDLAGFHLIWLTVWCTTVAVLFHFFRWDWMVIPWVPVSMIGTALAFYLGFKNNQAYDRIWEARKIWGSIVNSSRSFGAMLMAFETKEGKNEETTEFKKNMIKRHIAWLYTFREQLLQPVEWEHVSLKRHFGLINQKRTRLIKVGFREYNHTQNFQKKYLTAEEFNDKSKFRNFATHLILQQGKDVNQLKNGGYITDFNQTQLQDCLNDFYNHQGRAERIKKFPLPRQFAQAGFLFIIIFIALLPLGLVNEFSKLGTWGIWTSIPFCVVVGWVYLVMELTGDYSENPFEGLMNDTPMLSICRTIEIDLLQMIDEDDLPKPIDAVGGILM